MFGSLLIKTENNINYQSENGESVFSLPYASELISIINEIEECYRAIFDYYSDLLPFSKKIDQAIDQVKFDSPHLFEVNSDELTKEEINFVLKDTVKMVISCIAVWMSDQINDGDLELWGSIDRIQ